MVVSHRRNRLRSVVTLALVALFLVQVPAPFAHAQVPETDPTQASPNPQLSVEKIARIYQDDSSTPTHFLHNGTAKIFTTIYNQAQTALNKVPVYFWFNELPTVQGSCQIVSIPAATPRSGGVGTDAGNLSVSWSPNMPVPADVNAIGYNVTILVNRDPPASLSAAGNAFDPARGGLAGCGGQLPAPRYGACTQPTLVTPDPTCNRVCTSFADPNTDCNPSDNVAFGYFVKDAQWDLGVDGVQHCVRLDGVAKCGADDLAQTLTGAASNSPREAWLNATHRPGDWVCDNAAFVQADRSSTNQAGCPPKSGIINWGDTTPALSYFAIGVKNHVETFNDHVNATWNDDVDYSTCDFTVTNSTDSAQQQVVTAIPRTTSNCERIPYDVAVTVTGFGLPAAGIQLSTRFEGFLGARATQSSLDWNLTGMAGNYRVDVLIDPRSRLPVHAASEVRGGYRDNDAFALDKLQVLDVDFRAELQGISHTTIETAYEYPPDSTIDVPISAEFFNDGLANPIKFLWQRPQVQNNVATGSPTTVITHKPVNVSVWVDNFTSVNFYTEQNSSVGNATTMLPAAFRPDPYRDPGNTYGPWFVNRTITYSTKPTDGNYIPPGQHTIYACIDCDPRHDPRYKDVPGYVDQPEYWSANNRTFERNETNDYAQADFYIKNEQKPIFETINGISNPYLTIGDQSSDFIPLWKAPTKSLFHPHENMSIWSKVSDLDQPHLNVSFQFTLKDNTSIVRSYVACGPDADSSSVVTGGCVLRATADPKTYLLVLRDFGRATNNTTETWELRTIANNSFGKVSTSTPTTFTLARWPIQTENQTKLLFGLLNATNTDTTTQVTTHTFFPDNSTFAYGDCTPKCPTEGLVYWVRTTEDQTGIHHQENISRNFDLTIYFPQNKTRTYNGTTWISRFVCNPAGSGNPGGVNPPGVQGDGSAPAVTCNVDQKYNFSSFNIVTAEDRLGPGIPGHWNVSINVTDLGGEVRTLNTSLNIIDSPPILDQAAFSTTDVKPGDTFKVHVNASDDFEVADTYVNFSRRADPNHYNVSFKLKLNGSATPGFSAPATENGRLNYSYDDNITTGRGKMFGVGGTYDAWFSSKDKFDNWATTPAIKFVLNDTDRPNLLDAGVDQSLQEVGLDVTFHANATDQTNITAYLTVLRADERIVPHVAMNETSPGNYTYTTNFTNEGNFVWQIEIVDSVDQHSDLKSGPLSIRDNLGPRFEIRQPANLIDGQLYGRAAPQIGFVVYDADGVARDSIHMEVNGATVVPDDVVASTADLKGFIVTYTVPPTHKFSHRDVVRVNLSAVDTSNKALKGYNNFTFVVDDVPPVVRLADFGPRFRAEDRNAWNVSPTTLFTLTADDNDGLPTTVDAIRYRIIGGGNNAAESVYSGPFRIGDVAGIYTGPRIYQIQFWAIDSVGNQNRTFESVTVYVDEVAPSLDPFGVLPQGRFINATFIDDRSGVDRAVVWYSTNGGPYTPVALDFVGGLWTSVLPEGKKGDKISYYLQAWDRVNNTDVFGNATAPYASYTVGNHVPTIKITSPTEGSRIARIVDLLWTAADEDGDPLTFLVYYRAPGKTNFVELAKLETPDTRRFQLDTNRFQDGEYTFRVTAADGSFVALSDTKVSILNRGSAIGPVTPPPGQVAPGESILLKAEITKAQATVEARVYRDGNFVASYPMNDEGRDGDVTPNDGIYSVRVSFDQAGKYSVDILARYQEGGETKEDPLPNAATFSVKLTPAGILQQYQALLVLAGLLAVAGVGVAAFVLLRRR